MDKYQEKEQTKVFYSQFSAKCSTWKYYVEFFSCLNSSGLYRWQAMGGGGEAYDWRVAEALQGGLHGDYSSATVLNRGKPS